MIADTLDWNVPGNAPYIGTYAEWVTKLPEPQRGQLLLLIAKVQSHDYDAVVYVDRDTIRDASGKSDYSYAPEIVFMASGAHGAIYRDVVRKGWTPDHLESGMIFCVPSGTMCAVRWSVCNNWSIIFRTPTTKEPVPDSFESGYIAPVVAPPPATNEGGEPSTPDSPFPPAAPMPIPVWGWGGGGGGSGFVGFPGGGGGGGYPCPTCLPICPPAPVSSVPEPGSYALLAGGLALLAWRRKWSSGFLRPSSRAS